jgi:Protein of unknown function (DUF3106)
MQRFMPLMLVALACLLIATTAAAQTAPVVPLRAAPPGEPMQGGMPKQPLDWSSLSADQQRMLAPVRNQWDQLPPRRQRRLADHASHWATMPPGKQVMIRKRLTQWAAMTPEQRRQLRENARAFHDLSPEQRARVREAFQRFQSLPPAKRRALRERWHSMSPQQRLHWAAEHPQPPIPLHPPVSGGH